MRPEALAALTQAAGTPGNPSSIHHEGQRARRRVDEAARQVLAFLGVPAWELVWTGSVAEALALAQGARMPGGIAARLLDRSRMGAWWPAPILGGPTAAPTAHATPTESAAGARTGRVGDLGEAEVLVASPNAWGGPRGLAVVATLRGLTLPSLWSGGGQQRGVRSGSLPVALIVAAGEASRVACAVRDLELERAQRVTQHLESVRQVLVNGEFAGAGSHVELGTLVIDVLPRQPQQRPQPVSDPTRLSASGELDRLQAALDSVGLACALEPGPRLVLTSGWSTTPEELAPLANMLQTALASA